MLAKSCPKVSLQSRLSRESYDTKFGMDECARNNYGVTLIPLVFLLSFGESLKILASSVWYPTDPLYHPGMWYVL